MAIVNAGKEDALGAHKKPAKLLRWLWLLCWLAPPQGECARASQICFLVPLPPTPELSSLPTQLLYKSKGNILPLLFFSFPEQIGCHYVQLSLLRLGRGRRGQEERWKEETILEKCSQSIRGGKQPPATRNQHFTRTLIYWGNPERFNI